MYKIQTLNAISDVIHTQLSADAYIVAKDEPVPDAILVRSADMHALDLPQSVLAIARAGAGTNNIPIDACSKRGVAVFNTPGANANAVAELVTCALTLCSRNVVGGIDWARTLAGKGAEVPKLVEKGKNQFVGPEVRGKTLAVIGLGAIGAIVANAAAQGLGMNVVGYDPFISVESAWALSRAVKRASSLEDALRGAEYVTLHLPLTDASRGMFGQELLSKMFPGAHLLNFSRAELVAFEPLKAALEAGRLASYITDFPTDDVLSLPKAICIPHLGASTPESEENCARMAAAQLRDYLEDGQIHNSVNLPEIALGHPEGTRVMIIHENVPSMVSAISAAISRQGININNMLNRSRKDMAVTVLELDRLPDPGLIAEISAIQGIARVRIFG